MTEQPQFQPPAAVVRSSTGTRLEKLLHEYRQLKPTLDAAEKRMKELKDAIKFEGQQGAGNFTAEHPTGSISIVGEGYAEGVNLELTWVPKTSFDVSRVKKERPDIYAFYAKAGGAWYLRAPKGDE